MEQLTQETYIKKELKKFNVTDAAIAEMSGSYMSLEIKGMEDKEGFQQVHEARMVVKSKRVEVEKKRKELVADALAYQKAVNNEAKRITSLLEPIESHLQAQEDKIEQEKERIRLEKERLEKEKLDSRVTKLTESGMLFNGLIYYYEELSIDREQIKIMEDGQFNAYAGAVKERRDKEKERLAGEEKKRQEEIALLRELKRQQEAEAKKLEEEKARLKEEQDRIGAEKKAAAEQKLKNRKQRLSNIGFYSNGEEYYYDDLNIYESDFKDLPDDEFENKLSVYSDLLQKKKEQAEAKRQQEIEEAKQQAIKEQKEKEEKERKRLSRIEARKPDKYKLEGFAISLGNLPFPQVKSEEYEKVVEEIKTKIGTLIAFINNSIEEIEK